MWKGLPQLWMSKRHARWPRMRADDDAGEPRRTRRAARLSASPTDQSDSQQSHPNFDGTLTLGRFHHDTDHWGRLA